MESLAPAFEIVTVKTGLKSLRCLQRKETFHPGIGPQAEAELLHVKQQRIVDRAREEEKLVIWDVGLGAAANAIAALDALRAGPRRAEVEIHSFDISTAPLEFALSRTEDLTYLAPYQSFVKELIEKGAVEVAPGLRWFFHAGDFRAVMEDPKLPAPSSIFYDPYSPATNRDMWTLNHFTRLRARLSDECLLTNYTRSTAVRVSWLLAGFFVGVGDAIHEKAETTVAATSLSGIAKPLDLKWLARVKVSRNGAPVRGDEYQVVPINEADYARLAAHPQFQAR